MTLALDTESSQKNPFFDNPFFLPKLSLKKDWVKLLLFHSQIKLVIMMIEIMDSDWGSRLGD